MVLVMLSTFSIHLQRNVLANRPLSPEAQIIRDDAIVLMAGALLPQIVAAYCQACPSSKHSGLLSLFFTGGSGSPWLMLSGLSLMVQAAFLNGPFFDLLSPFDPTCGTLRVMAPVNRVLSPTRVSALTCKSTWVIVI